MARALPHCESPLYNTPLGDDDEEEDDEERMENEYVRIQRERSLWVDSTTPATTPGSDRHGWINTSRRLHKAEEASLTCERGVHNTFSFLRDTYVEYAPDKDDVSEPEKTTKCRTIGFHVKVLWVCLSVMVTVGCSFSLLQPHWFSHQGPNKHALGLFTCCITGLQSEVLSTQERPERITQCGVYGGHFRLGHLPSNAWQVACLLYGGGCVLLGISSLAAITSLLIADKWADTLTVYTGYLQTMAVILLIIALVVFPAGLESKFVRRHCGKDAHMYSAGQCHMGWAYMLAIMSTGLAMFSPVLSQYTDFREGYDASSTDFL